MKNSIIFFCVAVMLTAPPALAADKFPDWGKVSAMVSRHFATMANHRENDLITKSQVQPIFRQLQTLGWKVGDENAILRDVLDDANFLALQLRTPSGRSFMAKVSTTPLAYDRLDNAARLPGGRLLIKDFLRFENSERSLDADNGKFWTRLARLAPDQQRNANVPSGQDFLKPTGRIYTKAQLIDRLKQSYDAESQRRRGGSQR